MSRSKVIFVDDITSYDYGFSYSGLHKSNENLTYIVFSEYEGFKEINHGDIYYNGDKITFINDIDNSKIVSDGFSHYMPYVNSDNNISLTRSYIYLEREDGTRIDTTYTIFPNSEDINITYKHYSEFDKYVDINESYWGDAKIVSPNRGNIIDCGVRDGVVSLSNYGNNCIDVTLSYNYNIYDEWYEDTFAIKLRKPVYPSEVEFLYDVEENVSSDIVYLPAGSYYVPKISVSPALADSYDFSFAMTDINYDATGQLTNTHTGETWLNKPGSSFRLNCSYKTSATSSVSCVTSKRFFVTQINPHLSLVSTYTTYLWSDSNYNKTTCYLQSNLINPTDVTLKAVGNRTKTVDPGIHYITVNATDLDSNNLVIVKAEITSNSNKYNKDLRSCAIKLYGGNNLYTQSELTIQDVSNVVNGTATFVLSDTNMTTDYNIESDDAFITATITNIVNSGSKIYTYVTISGISNFQTDIRITPSNSTQSYTLSLYNTSNTNVNINGNINSGNDEIYKFKQN